MAKLHKLVGKIDKITRLNSSVNGNPRFTLEVNGEILCTKSDYSYCYNIENLYNKGCLVEIEFYDTKLSSRIQYIKEYVKK